MKRTAARADEGTATWLYCVVQAARAPSLARVPPGGEGMGPPRLLAVGARRWLVVADAPLARYGEAAIERGLKDLEWVSRCALAHESVVEHFLRAEAVLPMKLFTLFADDARAIDHVAKRAREIDAICERVAGCVEWGLRVSLDEIAARRRAGERAAAAAGGAASGTGFLLRKKGQQEATRQLARDALDEAERIDERLRPLARDAHRRPPVAGAIGSRLVLDASYLVEAASAARFKKEAKAIARALAGEGYALALTGPWPPYNFVADAKRPRAKRSR